MQYDTTVV